MDGVSVLLAFLTVIVVGLILYLNLGSLSIYAKEGFEDTVPVESKADAQARLPESTLQKQIKAVLEPMNAPELCPLFEKLRSNMLKNEKAGQQISDAEAMKRVETALALKIPGGALPCPLLQYPADTASDLEWLTWLQTVPVDFGARVVFMAIFLRKKLVGTERRLKESLSTAKLDTDERKKMKQKQNMETTLRIAQAKAKPFDPNTEYEEDQQIQVVSEEEGFATICPPDVASTRRAEKLKAAAASSQTPCALPEEITKEQIQEAVSILLKQLVGQRSKLLVEKGVDPTGIDLTLLLQKAKASQDYLEMKQKQQESGTLDLNSP
jgi:hypothetical protein